MFPLPRPNKEEPHVEEARSHKNYGYGGSPEMDSRIHNRQGCELRSG